MGTVMLPADLARGEIFPYLPVRESRLVIPMNCYWQRPMNDFAQSPRKSPRGETRPLRS